MILALSRAAPKKNLGRLLEAFAKSRELRDAANLVIVAVTVTTSVKWKSSAAGDDRSADGDRPA